MKNMIVQNVFTKIELSLLFSNDLQSSLFSMAETLEYLE